MSRAASSLALTLLLALATGAPTGCAPAESARPPPAADAKRTSAHVARAEHRESGHEQEPRETSGGDEIAERLAAVARIHGGAGPWAVAGYRMGAFALRSLGLDRGSFDLEVVHYTPHDVQYACIADGASASTGASVGKLNLSLADAPAPETRTVYRRRAGGASITLRVTKAFASRFLDVPRERLGAAGREAMQLPDDDVFEVVP